MIIATLFVLLFFGGSGAALMTDGIENLQDSIKSELSKGSTRDAAMDVADQMKDINKDYGKADSKAEKAFIKLIADYGTSTAELQNNLSQINERRGEYQQKMLNLRFDLKKTLTSDEWNKLFAMTEAN